MKLKLVPMETRLKMLQLSCFEICPKMYIRLPKIACKISDGKNPNWAALLYNISCSFFFQTMCKCHKSCLSLSLACMYRSQHHHSIILKLRIQVTYLRIARKSLENQRLSFLGQPPSKLPFFLSSLSLFSMAEWSLKFWL